MATSEVWRGLGRGRRSICITQVHAKVNMPTTDQISPSGNPQVACGAEMAETMCHMCPHLEKLPRKDDASVDCVETLDEVKRASTTGLAKEMSFLH